MTLDFTKAMAFKDKFVFKLRDYLAGDSFYINTYTDNICGEDSRLTHTKVPLDQCWWDTSGGYNYHNFKYHAEDHTLSDEWWQQVVGECIGTSQ